MSGRSGVRGGESEGYDGNAVAAPVGVPSGVEHDAVDQTGTELATQPQQVAYVCITEGVAGIVASSTSSITVSDSP